MIIPTFLYIQWILSTLTTQSLLKKKKFVYLNFISLSWNRRVIFNQWHFLLIFSPIKIGNLILKFFAYFQDPVVCLSHDICMYNLLILHIKYINAPHNISVDEGPHMQSWSHRIITELKMSYHLVTP